MATEIIEQDGVEYKFEDGIYKGCKGESPFKRVINDNGIIREGVTQQEIDIQNNSKIKQDKINVFLQDHSTVWVGKTPDGTKDYAVVIGNDGKLSTIEIK